MGKNMKENGLKDNHMEMGSIISPMEPKQLHSGKGEENMDWEFNILQQEKQNMKDNSGMEQEMGKDS